MPIGSLFQRRRVPVPARLRMSCTRLGSFEDYRAYVEAQAERRRRQRELEAGLADPRPEFELSGLCIACRRRRRFTVRHGGVEAGATPDINWRETLVCQGCGLANRSRAALHLCEQELAPRAEARIYLTEQLSPFHAWMAKHYRGLIGSEFVSDTARPGLRDAAGVRHEDITRLSFGDRELDFVLSFDVLEHVPDPMPAFRECRRVLRSGGRMLFTVPFAEGSATDIVRARLDGAGEVEHLLPPEYHGDPLREDGCLCFRHFGWQVLDELREAGFREASALYYWSRELCYLGSEQVAFEAVAP